MERIREVLAEAHQLPASLRSIPLQEGTEFDELGLDSLGYVELLTALQTRWQFSLTPGELTELETVGQLAELVGASPRVEPGLLARCRSQNERVESYRSEGKYFFETPIESAEGVWVFSRGQRQLMMASYNYLGLADNPRLKTAAQNAMERYGTGCHGVRLTAGTLALHKELEKNLADFLGTEDAIVYNSGFLTNVATVSSLVQPRACCTVALTESPWAPA